MTKYPETTGCLNLADKEEEQTNERTLFFPLIKDNLYCGFLILQSQSCLYKPYSGSDYHFHFTRVHRIITPPPKKDLHHRRRVHRFTIANRYTKVHIVKHETKASPPSHHQTIQRRPNQPSSLRRLWYRLSYNSIKIQRMKYIRNGGYMCHLLFLRLPHSLHSHWLATGVTHQHTQS